MKELAEQLADVGADRRGEVKVDGRGLDAGVAEQDLHDADVHAPFEQAGGEAVAESVTGECVAEQALRSRDANRLADRVVGNVTCRITSAWEEPLPAAMQRPDLTQHVKSRFAQRDNTLLVPLTDDP